MDDAVLPECYVGTCLIETLVPLVTHYNHQKGSGTVARKMQRFFKDRFALGIIDKDKRELYYLREFTLVIKKNNLELYKHDTLHHYLILITPAIEAFIIGSAKTAGISVTSFDLPGSFDEFRKVSKTLNSKKDPRFIRLFKGLVNSNEEEIQQLAYWINYLKEKNYKADLKLLANK